ncbi:hypothetical protein [Streptomyces sp. NPDC003717]|uniref:hypothetical protein n=1 Tax=Streptomyces sp. NPDC003717 TaxID=3154276 RepID=UPI0033B08246
MRQITATGEVDSMPSDTVPSSHTAPPDALKLLTLPDVATLTPDQRRGAVCVWGDEQLHADTAVDLGERTGAAGRWWPRACPRHAGERAHRALFDHAPLCEQCTDDSGRCETNLNLYRLVRDGRR